MAAKIDQGRADKAGRRTQFADAAPARVGH